jgi:hypothetical protein
MSGEQFGLYDVGDSGGDTTQYDAQGQGVVYTMAETDDPITQQTGVAEQTKDPLTKSLLPDMSETKWMLLISCEACFALGAIGFGIAMVWIGENRQNDDDRGAIALIFINITDVSKSYLLPISRIFGSALIASGLVYLFQVMRMVKCTNRMFGIADKEHRQKESVWKDAMFISDVRRIVTVAALQFVLHMAAGQRLGEYLILDLQNIALVFICLLAARAET